MFKTSPPNLTRPISCHIAAILFSLILLSCSNQEHAKAPAEEPSASNKSELRQKILSIIHDKKATVGLAVASLDDASDTLAINGDEDFALMSVAKFPQALLLLHLSDSGKYDRSLPLTFGPEDLKQFTGSSIRKDHPQSSFSLSLPEVLRYMIGQSDNISANKVFALEGGPKAVEAYVHSLGVTDIGIATDYAHMNPDAPKQNHGTPKSIVQLLSKFHRRELLSDSSQTLLWTAMVEATSGANRLKAGLPEGALIGHKTGTSGRDGRTGVTPAFNDVGIIRLADGRHYAIAVFVGDTWEGDDENAAIIASISKAVWEYFSTKK